MEKWEAMKSPLADWVILSGEELIARELRHWNKDLLPLKLREDIEQALAKINKDNSPPTP